MMDFSGKVALITGGTRGIGLETALAFAKRGAQCVLTFNWGDHDRKAIEQAFEKIGGPKPLLYQADVANPDDTADLFEKLKHETGRVDIFISNVSMALVVKSFEDYSLNALKKSISYSSWPMVSYAMKSKEILGAYPGHIIGMSSPGPDYYHYGYDFVAASKTVMEVLCRYLTYQLRTENVVVNTVRSRAIKTQSLETTFGKELEQFLERVNVPDNYWIQPEEIANTIIALCSGYCDAIRGETIHVDRGTCFFDNMMGMYAQERKMAF